MTISKSNWTTVLVDTCISAYSLASAVSTTGTASSSTSGGNLVLTAPATSDMLELTQNVAAGVSNTIQLDINRLTGGNDNGVQVVIVEEINNVEYVIGSGYLHQGSKQTLNFTPKIDVAKLKIYGPFGEMLIASTCSKKAKTVQHTYLVDVCDEDGDRYRFGFNGKEKDNDWAGIGNIQDYGFRNYNTRLARFFREDPLTKEYPWYTPYQFSGNNPIMFIDRDGLEPAKPEAGKKNLLVVVQGYVGDPKKDNTQAKNASKYNSKAGVDKAGLGHLESLATQYPDLQIVTFASGSFSQEDVEKTIRDFYANVAAGGQGKIIAVGHSMGAHQLVNISNNIEIPMIDLMITIDAQSTSMGATNTTVGRGTRSAINYHTDAGSFDVGGTKLKFKSDFGINKQIKGTWHTAIDNVLSLYNGEGEYSPDASILMRDVKNGLNYDGNFEPTDNAKQLKIQDMSQQSLESE